MAIKIQYRRVWSGVPDAFVDVGTFEIDTGTNQINVTMPRFGQSDRLVPASKGFACDKVMDCILHATATRDADTNAVTFTSLTMDTFKFHYVLYPGVNPGEQVVPGRYQFWFSPDDGAVLNDVYTSSAPSVALANYTDNVSYSQTLTSSFSANAQEASNYVMYGRCYNHTNGNDLRVYLRFVNDYPADYRPGKILKNSDWYSHNRSGGAANIYNGTSYRTMRTLNGGVGTAKAPYIKHSSGYKNQRKIGRA